MERVSIRDGKQPIIILAPHGADDDNTNHLAMHLAETLDACAVINNGWERAPAVDFWNDKANCNDISHCHQPVVKEEFLDPILDYVYKLRNSKLGGGSFFDTLYVFIIHGFSLPKKPVDIILGYGEGKPQRHTCDLWRKSALGYFLAQKGFEVALGAAGSNYAGWGHNNLNQLFRDIWYPDESVQSIQIEVGRAWRESPADAMLFAKELAETIESLMDHGDVEWKCPITLPIFG